jgi:phosphatidate phosphatase APP1
MTGDVFLVGASGVSVVSDIDDTIKVSEVRDRSALMRNTFVRPHRAVEGMSGLYRDWVQRPGVAVHYLSAGPWPMARSILEFLRAEGFPGGALYLRDFSWSREGVAGLLAPTREHKGRVLEELLGRWPERTLVLVGDSGEQDPEIYADIARRHVGRVVGIAIRDVTGGDAGAERYRRLREGIPGVEWVVFQEARELEAGAQGWFE